MASLSPAIAEIECELDMDYFPWPPTAVSFNASTWLPEEIVLSRSTIFADIGQFIGIPGHDQPEGHKRQSSEPRGDEI